MNQEFLNKKYLIKRNFLDQQSCQEYVEAFRQEIEQGRTKKDPQCPLSHSLGHSELFDSLLEQLTPHIEEATGLELHPTYAYARWYAPGDELKIHRDRESCEITTTLNLGFEGNQWPIYMGVDEQKQNCEKVDMNIGDAVIFRGQELYHWREKYIEGQWQAQVFLHYVDKNGPHAEWKYDKRKSLAHHNNTPVGHFHVIENAFSREKSKEIEEKFNKHLDKTHQALLAGNKIDLDIRDTKRLLLPLDRGLGAMLIGIAFQTNFNIWKFDVTHCTQVEFLNYDKNGKFTDHIDTILADIGSPDTRKLTFIFIVNDEFEGGKLYFKFGKDKLYPPQKAGTVIVFPSFLTHGVEPVTEGNRKTIVGWLVGPYLK